MEDQTKEIFKHLMEQQQIMSHAIMTLGLENAFLTSKIKELLNNPEDFEQQYKEYMDKGYKEAQEQVIKLVESEQKKKKVNL